MPQIWRLNLPATAGNQIDLNAFCLENDVVGVGWPVESTSDALSWEGYVELGKRAYPASADPAWWTILQSLKTRMATGDLCWTRDATGRYYLGRILGVWQYRRDPEFTAAGIFNTRHAQWLDAGNAFEVPGSVLTSFRSSQVLRRITGDGIEVFSGFRFNGLTQKSHYEFSQRPCDFFSLLSQQECEDLVGIYLQLQSFLILPGTCNTDTRQFNFLMKHRINGRHAAVRVHVGHQALDVSQWLHFEGDVFVFQKNGIYSGKPAPNVTVISSEALLQCSQTNIKLLPASLQKWLKVWQKVVGVDEAFLS